jgi:hypothetical protein
VKKLLGIVIFAVIALTACDSEPKVQNIEVTRIVEIPVTVISEVQVTRFVQLTRLIDVTLEVTRVKEVEVTRIIDKVITPTPSATPADTPTPTNPAQSVPVTGDQEDEPTPEAPLGSQLLASMINLRDDMQTYAFHIDNGVSNGYLICQPLIERHDRAAAAPSYDIASSGLTVQNAYQNYRDALSIFIQGANPLTLNCRDFILRPVPRRVTQAMCIGSGALNCQDFVPEQQWTTARAEIIRADDILFTAINNLDAEFDVPG